MIHVCLCLVRGRCAAKLSVEPRADGCWARVCTWGVGYPVVLHHVDLVVIPDMAIYRRLEALVCVVYESLGSCTVHKIRNLAARP